MDDWAWEQLQQWLTVRVELPVGPLFCILTGPTRGRAWSQGAAREQLRHTAALAGVRRRFAPHQLRHAHAVEMAREGVPLIVIQRLCRDRDYAEAVMCQVFEMPVDRWVLSARAGPCVGIVSRPDEATSS